MEAVGEDYDVGGESDFGVWGGGWAVGGRGVGALGTESDGGCADAREGKGGQVDAGVVEAGEPGCVENAAFTWRRNISILT